MLVERGRVGGPRVVLRTVGLGDQHDGESVRRQGGRQCLEVGGLGAGGCAVAEYQRGPVAAGREPVQSRPPDGSAQ